MRIARDPYHTYINLRLDFDFAPERRHASIYFMWWVWRLTW